MNDLKFATISYMNDHLKTVCLFPKEDQDEHGQITLQCRKLHKAFMAEPSDVVAASYIEQVKQEVETYSQAAEDAKKAGNDEEYTKLKMRMFYALHCLAKMNL